MQLGVFTDFQNDPELLAFKDTKIDFYTFWKIYISKE